jgi:hypothetical protein
MVIAFAWRHFNLTPRCSPMYDRLDSDLTICPITNNCFAGVSIMGILQPIYLITYNVKDVIELLNWIIII